jgi:hypothetical protein
VPTFCRSGRALVGAAGFLPDQPFEFGWAPAVGCNRLRCQGCAAPVRATVRDASGRRYKCRCHEHIEHNHRVLWGSGRGVYQWQCAGHPQLELPATLDTVRLTGRMNWAQLARRAILEPPSEPPWVEGAAPWLLRVHALLPRAQRLRLSGAVLRLADSGDPAVAGAALDAVIRMTDDFHRETVHALAVERLSLPTAKVLALTGLAPYEFPDRFLREDPDWLWSNVAVLVAAQRVWLDPLVRATQTLGWREQEDAVREIAGVDTLPRAAVSGAVERAVTHPLVRAELLRVVAEVRDGTHDCRRPGLFAVGPGRYQPVEPFEHSWHEDAGCDQLICDHCGQRVGVYLLAEDPGTRRHECGCTRYAVADRIEIGLPADERDPWIGTWECAGHPDLSLPVTLDGLVLTGTTDWAAVAARGILDPPFQPAVGEAVPWLVRLYHLLPGYVDRLGHGVADQLSARDPRLVRGALDYFRGLPRTAVSERVASVLARRRSWLRRTRDPSTPDDPLWTFASTVRNWVADYARLPARPTPVPGPAAVPVPMPALPVLTGSTVDSPSPAIIGALVLRPSDHPVLDLLARAFDVPAAVRRCPFFVYSDHPLFGGPVTLPPEPPTGADTEAAGFVRYLGKVLCVVAGDRAAVLAGHPRDLRLGWYAGRGGRAAVTRALADSGRAAIGWDDLFAREHSRLRDLATVPRLSAMDTAEARYILDGGAPPVPSVTGVAALLAWLDRLDLAAEQVERLRSLLRAGLDSPP